MYPCETLLIMNRLKLTQEPKVVFKKQADVVDPVFEHGDSFDSHTQGISGVSAAVDTAQIEHIRVYHSATENLYPSGMFTDVTTLAATDVTCDIHLGARLCEREIRRPQADLRIGSKHLFHKKKQDLFHDRDRKSVV